MSTPSGAAGPRRRRSEERPRVVLLSQPTQSLSYRSPQENGFRLMLRSDPAGSLDIPGVPEVFVSIHVGPSVQMVCHRDGSHHRGLAVHGDVDIIPAGTRGRWELAATDTALLIGLSPRLLDRAAEESGLDPRRLEIRNRFQVRDPQLEHIGWAMKSEVESGYPCGRVYLDSLALAVAARLVHFHSSLSIEPASMNGKLSGRKLKDVLCYIEDNIAEDISLGDIAAVSGLSVSHFKKMFRDSVGLPVHQYLIRRRVERAKELLSKGKLSISQIALETGFAHQSHLARHMRRLLGTSPRVIRDKN